MNIVFHFVIKTYATGYYNGHSIKEERQKRYLFQKKPFYKAGLFYIMPFISMTYNQARVFIAAYMVIAYNCVYKDLYQGNYKVT